MVVILRAVWLWESTLLRCLNGLESIQGGDILLDGQSIVENKKIFTWFAKRLVWSFKVMNSFPHLDVLQNLILGPIKAQGRDKKRSKRRKLANY